MERFLKNSLLAEFARSDEDKQIMVQWLRNDMKDMTVDSIMDYNKNQRTNFGDIVGGSMVMAGLVIMVQLTPVALAVGATFALLGEGVRFMEELCLIGDSYDEIKKRARFDTMIEDKDKNRQQTQESKNHINPTLKFKT